MANCSFVAVGTRTHSSTISLPAGIATGDLLLMCLYNKGTSRSWTATQTGWTSRKTQRSSDNFGFGEVYTRICDGTEGASFNIGGSPDGGFIIAYRPSSGFAFVVTPDAIGGAAGRVAPSLTPTASDDLLIYTGGATTSTAYGTITSPATFTTRLNEFHNSFYHVYFAELTDYASVSATGTLDPGSAGSSSLCIDALFLIAPSTVNVPFISTASTVYALSIIGDLAVPFISSSTSVHAPLLQGHVAVPFISSNTTVYTPSLTAPSSDVNVPFIASSTVVYGVGLPQEPSSGALALAADDAEFWPTQIPLSGDMQLTADAAQVPGSQQPDSGVLLLAATAPIVDGPITPTSGVLALTGDTPGVAGIITPSSGVLRLAGDNPLPIGAVKPSAGVLRVQGDAPVIYPMPAQAGKLVLKSDGPANIIPLPGTSGRLILTGTAPPYLVPLVFTSSGQLVLKADPPQMGHANFVFSTSGILRLRSDTPVVIPLTEPGVPPPIGSGVISVGANR